MNRIVKYSTLMILCLIVSCNDIFEQDLTDIKVELLAPANNLVTDKSRQKFWWNPVEGALWYELQVVTPDFSNIQSLKLDTLFEINNFQLSLQPGVYHWRVRALNGSTTTEYSTNSLTIIPVQ